VKRRSSRGVGLENALDDEAVEVLMRIGQPRSDVSVGEALSACSSTQDAAARRLRATPNERDHSPMQSTGLEHPGQLWVGITRLCWTAFGRCQHERQLGRTMMPRCLGNLSPTLVLDLWEVRSMS
jgi:hypothetical protein